MRAPLVREVARQMAQHRMLTHDELAVVGVSGGADSTALLLALHEASTRIVVAHLDHGFRAESAADASFVEQLAADLHVEYVVERRDVDAYRRERRLSVEAAAREVRHTFLREVAERRGAGGIFLAHTADDQVETLLLRLIRGAGVAGLSGMRPKDGLLRRPMLGVWRSAVEAYLHARGQEWREDASNSDRRFLRNRVRHELLPLLESMNPGVREVLLREAAALGERQQEVEAEVLRRYGLGARQIAAAVHGTPVTIRHGRQLQFAPAPLDLPVSIRHGRQLQFAAAPFDLALPTPGEVRIRGVGCVAASVSPLAPDGASGSAGDGAIYPSGASGPAGHEPADAGARSLRPKRDGGAERDALVDAEAIQGPLRVRSWRAGDRFQPLGMSGTKKLQDLFVDEHVPREERGRVPLVVDGSTIVWVAGMRVDERYRVTPATTQAIRLRFEPA